MWVGILTWLLQYFPKNRAILVQKLWGEKKLSKSVLAILRLKKKVPMTIKLEGGEGKALMAWPLVDELFFVSSLNHKQKMYMFYLFIYRIYFTQYTHKRDKD